MSKPLIDIMSLNQTRYGVTFNFDKAMNKLQEELEEFSEGFTKADTHEMVDALSKVIATVVETVTLLGYNSELVMKHRVRHLLSNEIYPIDFSTCKLQRQKA